MKLALLALPLALTLLSGCASKLDARLAQMERDIQLLAENDRAFQRAIKDRYAVENQHDQQLRQLSHSVAGSRAMTDRFEIIEVGGSSILRIKK